MKSKQSMARSMMDKKSIGSTRMSVIATLLFILCYTLGSLISYDPHDASWFYYSTRASSYHNWFGAIGAHEAALLIYLFGSAVWLLFGLLGYSIYTVVLKLKVQDCFDRVIAFSLLPSIGAMILHMHGASGGSIGYSGYTALVAVLEPAGT